MTSNGSRLAQRALILAALYLFIGAAEANAPQGRLKAFYRSIRMRYNRVEGIFLGYRLGVAAQDLAGLRPLCRGRLRHAQPVAPLGKAAWSTKRIRRPFPLPCSTAPKPTTGEITRTSENTVFTLLFKWDYQDYFRTKQGFEAKGAYRYRRRLLFLGRLSGVYL